MAQISIKLSKQTDMPYTNQQKLVEHLNFLLNNSIIPLLETKDGDQFDLEYDHAIKQYLFYSIQTRYLFVYTRNSEDEKSHMVKSILAMLNFLKIEFSNIPDKNTRSLFLESIENMEDYFLLANDPNINIDKPEYSSAIDYSSGIWVCIFALSLALNDQKYKNKIDPIIKKCQEVSNMLKDSVMKIAKDHGRIFSRETIHILDDIDLNKVEMVTQSVDEFLMKMDKELEIKK